MPQAAAATAAAPSCRHPVARLPFSTRVAARTAAAAAAEDAAPLQASVMR
jgi:hypothetical protein